MKLQNLRKIATVCYTKVKWEPYRKLKQEITQCPNYQRPGHGARNCHMPTRCVYCSEHHVGKECPKYLDALKAKQGNLTADDIQVMVLPKCANCGEKHFATSSKCLVRKRYIDSRKKPIISGRQGSPGLNPGNHRPKGVRPVPSAKDFAYDLNGQRSSYSSSQQRPSSSSSQQRPSSSSSQQHGERQNQPSKLWSEQVSDAHTPSNPDPNNLTPITNPFSIDEVMSLTSDVLNALHDVQSAPRAVVVNSVMRVCLKYLYYGSSR